MEIITNNKPRELISFFDLTEKERADFDYLGDDDYWNTRFFRYKGVVYDSQDCEGTSNLPDFAEWSGVFTETFFSGVVFKFVWPDAEEVVVGRYST